MIARDEDETRAALLYSITLHVFCSTERKAIISSTIFILNGLAKDKIRCARTRIYIRRNTDSSSFRNLFSTRSSQIHDDAFGFRPSVTSAFQKSAWNSNAKLSERTASERLMTFENLKFEFGYRCFKLAAIWMPRYRDTVEALSGICDR